MTKLLWFILSIKLYGFPSKNYNGRRQWFTVSSIRFLSDVPMIELSSGGNSLSINFIWFFYKIWFIYSIGVSDTSIFFSTVSTSFFSLLIESIKLLMYWSCFSFGIGLRRNLYLKTLYLNFVTSFHPSWSSTWAICVDYLGSTVLKMTL